MAAGIVVFMGIRKSGGGILCGVPVNRPGNPSSRPNSALPGFSLVELLVVAAVIGLVVAIVVPVSAGARRAAARVQEAAALRSLMAAWNSYAVDEGGFVIPGYRSGLAARDDQGNPIPPESFGGDVEVQRRWPWRLAPWLGGDLRRLYAGPNAELLEKLQSGDPSRFHYFVSLYPSFGMNTAWVGGDESRFPVDEALPNGSPNPLRRLTVTRLSDAKHPARTIAFASARTNATADGSMSEGHFRVDSPWLSSPGVRWAPEYASDDPSSFGSLSARFGGDVLAATLDGATEFVAVDALRDMQRWSDRAPEPAWWIGK
jgi:prepilin-type N-terminal cleavage/methylation domain-containing protein